MKISTQALMTPKHVRVTEIGYDDIEAFDGAGLFYGNMYRNESPQQWVFKQFVGNHKEAKAEGYVKMSDGIITGLYLDGIIINPIASLEQVFQLIDNFRNFDELEMKKYNAGEYSIRLWYD